MTSQSTIYCTICFLFFLKETHRRNAIKRFFKRYKCGAFGKDNFTTIKAYLTMLRAILYQSTLSPRSIFVLYFACALKSGLYDVTIHLVRLPQIFATEDDNMKMFSKIATFSQNQFTKQLICDLISQPIFKFSSTN